ncbi:MAG TPA: HupE/UreJ family protein [Candidatus Polarisedimenticolia bacterium]|nr:HupE/UreJ family protein [Candidatus Polarisedimenticolia bacterium]
MTRAIACALLVLLAGGAAAEAHDVRPAYLELREGGDGGVLEVLFKVPARPGGQRPLLELAWPEGAIASREEGGFQGDAWVERWRVERPGGFRGAALGVRGMENGLSDVLVRFEGRQGAGRTARLTAASPDFTLADAPRRYEVAVTYARLGVEHILFGVDHLLFVLALLLLTEGVWALVRTVTAFTLAHSLTLALATLGIARMPQAPVEATIALSIVFVAAEIVRRRDRATAGIDPSVVAFAFGLLHGFGFAGALHDVGIPEGAIPTALLFFNLGVEAGQLLFIAAALGLAQAVRRLPMTLPRPSWGWRVLPYAIGGVAVFWLLERLGALRTG